MESYSDSDADDDGREIGRHGHGDEDAVIDIEDASEEVDAPKQYFKGVVRQVMDGGAVVIRGPPRNGPPAERIMALTNIDAPRLARRSNPSNPATEVSIMVALSPILFLFLIFRMSLLHGRLVSSCARWLLARPGWVMSCTR